MAMKYLKVYYDWAEVTATLSDAERGRLITALVQYAKAGILPELTGAERHLFPMFQAQIDRDRDDYKEISEKRKIAGKRGGLAKASKCKQVLANGSKSCQDKEKDKDKYNPPTPLWGDERFRKAFQDFCAMRTKMKSPMTDRAKTMLINKLNELSGDMDTQIRVLDQSILNGWKSVYPLSPSKPKGQVRELE